MLHARKDYNRIQDPDELIPEDEPVFLIRGQDSLAVETLKHYLLLYRARIGSSPPDSIEEEMKESIRRQIERMRNWSIKKTPDMPQGSLI